MKTSLENNSCLLTVDSFGGAITDFHKKNAAQINPLSFVFSKEQMPCNNKKGAPYQGHFLCLGRWGLPSEGEMNSGMPNHGEAANIHWTITDPTNNKINMQTTAKLEGLHLEREIILDENNPVFAVKETIQNINPLDRLYNMVQHPTLATPFLVIERIIDCNADKGFNQVLYKDVTRNVLQWPIVKDEQGNNFDLKNPLNNYNAIFSFIVKQNDEYGWITAYSSKYNLLFGYVWLRKDYSWIHLWQHWDNYAIKYRGIEFGTAGIHQSFKEILDTATSLLGEKTFAYIDAGEIISKNYFSFIHTTEPYFTGVENITIKNNTIYIQPKGNGALINLKSSTELFS